MDRHRFNREVRPYVQVIPIGKQGIAFDRLDLDKWVDHYKRVSGRPVVRRFSWDVKERQVSISVKESGILTNKLMDDAFVKALALSTSKKRKGI
jgi:hypothetical protein